MDWGVKRGSPSYGLGERYTNSARRLGRVRTALRAASFTGFPSALLGGQSKRVARELETSEKGEGVGGGGRLRQDSRTLYPTHLRRSFRHRASLVLVSSQYQGKDTGY